MRNWLKGLFLRAENTTPRNSTDDWPFDQPRNTASITTRQVLEGSEPILLVSHDTDDHGWQFLGNTVTVEDGRVVGLGTILKHDPTLRQIADLPPGWIAERQSPKHNWQRKPHP